MSGRVGGLANKRVFCFGLTDDESAQPTKLVAYASRLPAPPRVGDQFKDAELSMRRDTLGCIINKLWRNPEVIMQCSNWLDNTIDAWAQRGGMDKFDSVSIVGKIDEDWLAAFLNQRFRISRPQLERMCIVDPDTMVQIVCFAAVVTPTLQLGDVCKRKLVLEGPKRIKHIGDERLRDLLEDLVNDKTGAMDWGKLGAYQVAFNDKGLANLVTHGPTGDSTVPEEHIHITRSFVLQQN